MASAFILETLHLQCANASFTDCDAKACYNCVVTIITALAKYKPGLPTSACILLVKALKQMTMDPPKQPIITPLTTPYMALAKDPQMHHLDGHSMVIYAKML
eukprot:11033645-Ditylum_brightwellii.AAC.1